MKSIDVTLDDLSFKDIERASKSLVFQGMSKSDGNPIKSSFSSLNAKTGDVSNTAKKYDDLKLFAILKENNVEYIDNRSKVGSLWLIGGHELDSVIKKCQSIGANFRFLPNGGVASKHRPAWYIK